MANTTNLDLVKPAGTDHALISVLNSNSDKIDAFAGQTNDSLSAEQNGLAYIVGNTNTTGGTLAVGQFVYVKGHSTIPEGLRKVTSSISANGSITTSNTDACSEGGLNALNSNITSLSDQIATFDTDTYNSTTRYNLTLGSTTTYTIPSDGVYTIVAGNENEAPVDLEAVIFNKDGSVMSSAILKQAPRFDNVSTAAIYMKSGQTLRYRANGTFAKLVKL